MSIEGVLTDYQYCGGRQVGEECGFGYKPQVTEWDFLLEQNGYIAVASLISSANSFSVMVFVPNRLASTSFDPGSFPATR